MCIEVGRIDVVDLIKESHYVELYSPLLPEEVTWEKYFLHESQMSNVERH